MIWFMDGVLGMTNTTQKFLGILTDRLDQIFQENPTTLQDFIGPD
jgi:hypothetical protein